MDQEVTNYFDKVLLGKEFPIGMDENRKVIWGISIPIPPRKIPQSPMSPISPTPGPNGAPPRIPLPP